MEPLEALRQARYLNEESVVIVNDFPLTPVHVRIGEYEYPAREEIYSRLREFTPRVHAFNIDELSLLRFNSLRQVNTISLGIASALGRPARVPGVAPGHHQGAVPGFRDEQEGLRAGYRYCTAPRSIN